VPATRAQNLQPEKPIQTIRKGTVSVGTDLGLGNLSMDRISPNQTNLLYDIRLSPSIGYFVNDHLMLSASVFGGLAQDFNYFKEPVRYNDAHVGISIGGRYYFGKGVTPQGEVRKLRFYGEAGVGLAQRREKWTSTYSGDVSKSRNGYAFANLGAGINYFLTPNVAFETGLTYNRNFLGYRQADASLQIKLGIRVFLHK